MDRRSFLTGLISAGAAAVAAEFGVSEAMGGEIIDEFRKDLGRTVFGPPKREFLGNTVLENLGLWTSTADIRQFYADECGKALGRKVDRQILSAVRRMQACIDADFAEMREKGVPEGKVILEPPKVVKLNESGSRFELIAGSKPGKSFLGTDTITVGFISGAPEVIHDSYGKRARGQLVGVNGRAL